MVIFGEHLLGPVFYGPVPFVSAVMLEELRPTALRQSEWLIVFFPPYGKTSSSTNDKSGLWASYINNILKNFSCGLRLGVKRKYLSFRTINNKSNTGKFLKDLFCSFKSFSMHFNLGRILF